MVSGTISILAGFRGWVSSTDLKIGHRVDELNVDEVSLLRLTVAMLSRCVLGTTG